jgi:TPR repeat protein
MPKPTINSPGSIVAWSVTGALAVFLNFGAVAIAGDLAEGVAAYNQSDATSAWRLLRPLAERGDPTAQALVGSMYGKGLNVTYDGAEAVRWWRKAAEQGDASAQEDLAPTYLWGDGVQPDPSEAAQWFRKAAEQGEISAQTSLAYLYARGAGVSKDLALAHMWLSLAAAQGQPVLKIALDKLASKMTSEQVTEVQRLAREWNRTK